MDLAFAVYSFTAMFIVVDPIANVPIFLSILRSFSPEARKYIIRKAVITASLVLLIFTFTGRFIFGYLGIAMYSFKIAGGILLFIIAVEMLFGRRSKTTSSKEEEDEAKARDDVAATPLAVPLLAGPGAITTGIVLYNTASGTGEEATVIGSIILVFILTYFILTRSSGIFRVLGYLGTRVVVRVMGLLLSAIAVQFVVTGIKDAMNLA
jgi:multiple antibiotic resistance protein